VEDIDRYGINKKTPAAMANISSATLTKLAKGEIVNMEILVRICSALKCDLHDIVEIVPDETDIDNKQQGEKT